MRFRLKIGVAKADVTAAGGQGVILVGDTDDMVKFGATAHEQYEHFEARMLARATQSMAEASAPLVSKPKPKRKPRGPRTKKIRPRDTIGGPPR